MEIEALKQEVKELQSQLNTAVRNLRLASRWFSAYTELEEYMLARGLWSVEDIDEENPARTLINGFDKFLIKNTPKCLHDWSIEKDHEPGKRVCTMPHCGAIQLWNHNGYWDWPTENQEKAL